MRGLLAELRRRKVFSSAFTYLAAAWAVLQVADMFFPMLGLPDWSMTVVLLIAALGFPVAIILSWAFDFDFKSGSVVLTGDAPRDKVTAPASYLQVLQLLLILVLVALVGFLYYDHLFVAPKVQQEVQEPSRAPEHSIAVLPFDDMSAEGDQKYFAEGVSEELLHALAQVEVLKVAARTSSFAFGESKKDALSIGLELNVATLLEGSVRKSGNDVRITAQLIDTSNGFHLWSKTYDAKLEDIFSLQDDIAHQVVDAILPVITGEIRYPMGPTTSNIEAYNAYLQGRALLREPTADATLHAAAGKFRAAVEVDPKYTEAWAGLCDTLLADFAHNKRSNFQVFVEGEKACGVALTLSNTSRISLDVYIALGVLYREAGRLDESLEALLQAKKINTESVRVLQELGITYAAAAAAAPDGGDPADYLKESARYFSKAEDSLQAAVALNMGSWAAREELANFYFDTERFAKAVEVYDQVLALNPGVTRALNGKGAALSWLGQEPAAEAMWKLAIEQALASENYGPLGQIYQNLGGTNYYRGDFSTALAMYEAAEKYQRSPDHIIVGRLAETYRALGNKTEEQQAYVKAIELAEKALPHNPGNWQTLGLLAIYHGFSGNEEQARQYVATMEANGATDSEGHYFAALAYWSLGDTEAAYAQLAMAAQQKSQHDLLLRDPDLKQLRATDEQRFDGILKAAAD